LAKLSAWPNKQLGSATPAKSEQGDRFAPGRRIYDLAMIKRLTPLDPTETQALLELDVPAHLATLDRDGFPHITPVWFVWDDGAFYITSIAERPHLKRLAANPRAGIGIDTEDPERDDGQRPNRQVRAVGRAELSLDDQGAWTKRITRKYLKGPGAATSIASRAGDERMVICLRPTKLVAVASV
jgi:nitroimidazol reductase NimA-like FMN-containing flavoprotein (pyridoxamine 5'-phosphate oxidase superfamily)